MVDPQERPPERLTTETPEEFLEAEIEELERNTLSGGKIWAIALLGLILLAGAAFFITRWDNISQSTRVPVFTPEPLRLIEPQGEVDDAPVFRWDAVDGATSYIVQVRAAGRDEIERYAAYRVGYHRGLDALRANGWRGSGYVRWSEPTNRGFLRSLAGLGEVAAAIGETDEAERCAQFLLQLDPTGRAPGS